MRRLASLTLVSTFLTVAFAGCAGDEELVACFTPTALDEQKSKYKFDAGCSTGSVASQEWDFGDRTEPQAGPVVEHTYQYLNGMYSVTLTVKDKAGLTKTVTKDVPVGSGVNAPPVLYLLADKRRVLPNESVMFDATQTYDADGDPIYFQWDFNSPLAESDFNSMENLGNQQYGRYLNGPPPAAGSAGTPSSTGGNESGGSLVPKTPSGHVWIDEYRQAVERRAREVFDPGLHGEPGQPEPRNADFDGRIDDESPIQLFPFPSPATYFVVVRAYDVKGDYAEGFIRIAVETSVPNATDSYPFGGELQSGHIGPLDGSAGDVKNTAGHQWTQNFPAVVTATLTFDTSPQPGLPVTKKVDIFVCGGSQGKNECVASPNKATGSATVTLGYNVTADKIARAYQIFIVNSSDSAITYSLTVATMNDLNPWVVQEAGFSEAHH